MAKGKFNPRSATPSAFALLLQKAEAGKVSNGVGVSSFAPGKTLRVSSNKHGLESSDAVCLGVGDGLVHLVGRSNQRVWSSKPARTMIYPLHEKGAYRIDDEVSVDFYERGSAQYSLYSRYLN